MRRLPLKTSALVLAALLGAVILAASVSAQSTATAKIVAVDAVTTGNAATTLGPLNSCVRAEPGSSVTVDLVVDSVPADRGIIGFQIVIRYDPAILTLTAVNNEFLLAAKGTYEPFEGLSDPLPDSTGAYKILVADLASNPPTDNIESGPGVLSRLTFTAKAAGVSTVAPSFNPNDPADDYPAIIDNQNTTIGIDTIGTASIAVGRDCQAPPEATPVTTQLPPIETIEFSTTPTPGSASVTPGPSGSPGASVTPGPSGSRTPAAASSTPDTGGSSGESSDGGTSTGTVIAVIALVALGVVLAGGGGWMLLRRRAAGRGPA